MGCCLSSVRVTEQQAKESHHAGASGVGSPERSDDREGGGEAGREGVREAEDSRLDRLSFQVSATAGHCSAVWRLHVGVLIGGRPFAVPTALVCQVGLYPCGPKPNWRWCALGRRPPH